MLEAKLFEPPNLLCFSLELFSNNIFVAFIKNGVRHNTRNASYVDIYKYKLFCLNSQSYGSHFDFTKHSWRKFSKLQAFL